MSDIVVDAIRLDCGIILMVNPPRSFDEEFYPKFINKISREDKSSFLFPALYGNFDCVEGEIVSDEVYALYDGLKKDVSYENIFVFEVLNTRVSTNDGQYTQSINTLTEYVKEVIQAQNVIKSTHISDEFDALIQSPIYVDFLNEFDFTASETLILKGLFKYAFLTGISVTELIDSIKGTLEGNTNRKLLRKEFINVLKQRLS